MRAHPPIHPARPLLDTSRAQMATVLARAYDLEASSDPASRTCRRTTRTPMGSRRPPKPGIAAGFPDGTYRPDEPVTRGQMAAFIARAEGDA